MASDMHQHDDDDDDASDDGNFIQIFNIIQQLRGQRGKIFYVSFYPRVIRDWVD